MNTLRIFFVAFFLTIGFAFVPDTAKSQNINVSLSVFQNDLGRYGRWINSPKYGEVWIYSEPGFRPYYTNGRWEYTDYGWAWVSDYDWGWAPFHYGRWELDPYYGWMWIPGYEWAPAWVSWSEYGGNYGWAPLGFGLGINVSFGAIPFDRWAFVPRANICSPNLHNHYINPGRNRGFRNAVVINNVYVNNNTRFASGPRRNDVERYTRSRIPVRTIEHGRPQRIVMNDRSNNVGRPDRNTRNDRSDRSGRVNENRSSNNQPNREQGVDRPSNNFPDRNQRVDRSSGNNNTTPNRNNSDMRDRNQGSQSPSANTPDRNTGSERPSANTGRERTTERRSMERPSVQNRQSAPEARGQRTQEMRQQRTPEVRQQPSPEIRQQRTPEVRQQQPQRNEQRNNNGRQSERRGNSSENGRSRA